MSSITTKGSTWEWSRSIWMIWTIFFGMFTWISFLYIALRGKRVGWAVWGLLYFAIFLYGMSYFDPKERHTFLGEIWLYVILGTWVAGMLHAWVARKDYLLRLAAIERSQAGVQPPQKGVEQKPLQTAEGSLQEESRSEQQGEGRSTASGQSPVSAEPSVADAEEASRKAVAAGEQARAATKAAKGDALMTPTLEEELAEVTRPAQTPALTAAERSAEGPVDINHDPRERIARLPKVGAVLAMKAVSIRETKGGFGSVEEFVEAIGLKPHVADLLRDQVVIRPKR